MEKQEEDNTKKYAVNYWVDVQTETRLKKFAPFHGSRSHFAREALLKELDRLEQTDTHQEKIAS